MKHTFLVISGNSGNAISVDEDVPAFAFAARGFGIASPITCAHVAWMLPANVKAEVPSLSCVRIAS